MKDKTTTLYQGELKNYDSDEKRKMCEDILQYIKEKGLTVSQARELLTNVINSLSVHATLISIADYEKITGRDVVALSSSSKKSKKSPKKKSNVKLLPRNINRNTKDICKRVSLFNALFR